MNFSRYTDYNFRFTWTKCQPSLRVYHCVFVCEQKNLYLFTIIHHSSWHRWLHVQSANMSSLSTIIDHPLPSRWMDETTNQAQKLIIPLPSRWMNPNLPSTKWHVLDAETQAIGKVLTRTTAMAKLNKLNSVRSQGPKHNFLEKKRNKLYFSLCKSY